MIKDNLLNKGELIKLKSSIISNNFPWYFQDYIAYADSNEKGFYFTHIFYDKDRQLRPVNTPNSNYYFIIEPILDILKPKSLIRVKGNLYMSTSKLVYHPFHIDYSYDHKAAIFYINTNDGLTILGDGVKIKSIENRLLLFDGSQEHRSTSCTDKKYRMNINFNYQ